MPFAIQHELQDLLALKILDGKFQEGDAIQVERGKEGPTFSCASPAIEGDVAQE